jgi:succinoglycan biosynthesis protein ExoW
MQLDQSTSAFKRAGRIVATEHAALPRGDGLFAYRGDMFDQIMRGNAIGTSTVVFDRARFPAIRFREEYFSAGEDYLCWMDFARAGARFALSTQCEATYGRGVNVYAGARWGTAKHMTRVHNEFKYRHATMALHPVTPEQRRFLQGKKTALREEFALEMLYMLRRAQLPPLKILVRQLALDPATALSPLLVAGKRVAGHMGRWRERDRASK